MKKFLNLFFVMLIVFFVIGFSSPGPGNVSNTRMAVYEVVSDSTIDGFVDDLLTNSDTNLYYLVKDIEVEFDTGTAYASAGADSVFIFTRVDDDTLTVAFIDYHYFTDTINCIVSLSLNEAKTSGEQYWIDSPASEFTLGDRNYTIRMYYAIRQKYY